MIISWPGGREYSNGRSTTGPRLLQSLVFWQGVAQNRHSHVSATGTTRNATASTANPCAKATAGAAGPKRKRMRWFRFTVLHWSLTVSESLPVDVTFLSAPHSGRSSWSLAPPRLKWQFPDVRPIIRLNEDTVGGDVCLIITHRASRSL